MKRLKIIEIGIWLAICCHGIPQFALAKEHLPLIMVGGINEVDQVMEEIQFYAAALGLNDSVIIQVQYSLRVPIHRVGLITYENLGVGKKRHLITIWIQKRANRSTQLMALAHEMVHARQYIAGELVRHNPGEFTWMGEDFANIRHVPYRDRPWEKQAHKNGRALRLRYLKLKEQAAKGIPMS